MSTLAPADLEAVVVAILGDDASTRVPTPRPDTFVRVLRQGGSQINLVQSAPRLTVECWGPDDYAAFDRAADAWADLRRAEGTTVAGVFISRVEMTEPANFPDDDGKPRFQFVAQLTYGLKEIP